MIDDSQAEDSSSNPTQTATINVKPKSRLFPFLKNIPTKAGYYVLDSALLQMKICCKILMLLVMNAILDHEKLP